MGRKFMTFLIAVVLACSMVFPVLAADDLVLDITSVAKREMSPQGFEWFVKPGTYQDF